MKRLQLLLLFSLACFLLIPINVAHAKGTQVLVPDTVKDTHSKYTAKYKSGSGHTCTAILISSTAAITAKHCGGTQHQSPAGTIYPGASGVSTPFGYMNIRYYIPHPKYDVAVIKGIKRDQDKFYQYYIKPFTATVRGYSDEELSKFVDQEVYSYGYPYRNGVFKQYRSDGKVNNYSKYLPLLSTDIPAFEGQSGSGVFKKDGPFVGIIVSRARGNEAEVLPFSKEIATWINNNAK
ncbi:trypsin-like peptidase domain-containing protein [Staphylococcus pseudintermedius]|uniref:trypsin-like serine peptidase n=1 Tax=Staphylococcus pseudintermedius TaxID=283734 RepID=UPI0016566183|nr:trypsin-like peptidase domain-containing protein [Staphylococcus pseudintermedius]EHV5266417.1 trypsin-like peptidase domain-containing protein [Staphylococcus pseudintermedius]EJD5766883.1 trypsin-like peptidase domain-containing protein [Staphylococcus pseudintermedius]ELK4049512.1 trypsin-like peptidase domain-containing protein [Staphylococcus pseudintermedius]MBC8695739.1 trypsin-like serine protease [Staphylococcus pseudintermedius]MDK4062440.1 trypsin-like serine protease [Staphyloco